MSLIGACIADDQRQQMEKLATEAQWERVSQKGRAKFRPRSHILPIPLGRSGCGRVASKYKVAHRPRGTFAGHRASRGVRLALAHIATQSAVVTFLPAIDAAAAAGDHMVDRELIPLVAAVLTGNGCPR